MEDATLLAIRAQEDAGLDIITDGEIRRESYSNRIATALEGIDIDNPGVGLDRSGHPNPVPRIVGKIKRLRPIELEDLLFLKANTRKKVKITVPGPFTMLQQAQNDFYATEEEAAMDYAAALNEEIKDLFGLIDTKNRIDVELPIYDSIANNLIGSKKLSIGPNDTIIVEGIPTFLDDNLKSIFNKTLFIDVDEAERRNRFYAEYKFRGLTDSEIEMKFNSRESDEVFLIKKSASFADYCVRL
jgi:hypothetical protein